MMRYTIVDSNYNFVKLKADDVCGYELTIVNELNAYQLLMPEQELNNINRIINNQDYYNIYIDSDIKFPLLKKGIKTTIEIIELEEN